MTEKIMELNLLLLFLSGWEEDSRQNPGKKIYRAWNGYLFEVLNALEEKELITQFRNGKSVIITPEGIKKAEELKQKYIGGDHERKW
jgi:DNA-binding PadR family transcriptional regulator